LIDKHDRNIPKAKLHKISVLQEYGAEIMKIKDAYDKDTYRKLEPVEIQGILGIIDLGRDALADTEAVYD